MNKIKAFLFRKDGTYAYAVISFVMALVPEDVFKFIKYNETWPDWLRVTVSRVGLCIAIFLFVKLLYCNYIKNRRKVTISADNYMIHIQYGDILQITEGKRVINFDECFTTLVGEAPGDIKAASICGKYLLGHEGLDVKGLIESAGVKPLKTRSKYKEQERYESGTIVPNGNDLLMAFAKLDKSGRGCFSYEEYLNCLEKLWEQIDIYHGTKDVYLPVLGSNITYFMDCELTQQQLLDIMISSYRLSRRKLRKPYSIHIVCSEREGFSINNVFGLN
ncbi:macro domain-containing protein [Butyrivibrio fibrisolvens]|uniref:macro domain-containing protein n=1 Tax=Butyrivibrio fibrisolvens TaxID=831 RepID=UPI000403321E|nr:macro domain-containing protein [Butyrivibrio fibrisolvens]